MDTGPAPGRYKYDAAQRPIDTAAGIGDGNGWIAAHNRGENNHFGQIHRLGEGDRCKRFTQSGAIRQRRK